MTAMRQIVAPLLVEQREIRLASDAELMHCPDLGTAMHGTVAGCGLAPKQIADKVGVGKSMMSRVLSGHRMLAPHRWRRFIETTGSLYWIQYVLWGMGFRVVRRDMTVEEKAARFDAMMQEQMRQAS